MFWRRLGVAIGAALLFSLLFAYIAYTPVAEQHANTSYESFSSYVQIALIFSVPAYLLGAVPVSMVIDRFIRNSWGRFALYLASGWMVGWLVIFISFPDAFFRSPSVIGSMEFVGYGIIGLIASFIFFVLFVGANWLFEQVNNA